MSKKQPIKYTRTEQRAEKEIDNFLNKFQITNNINILYELQNNKELH